MTLPGLVDVATFMRERADRTVRKELVRPRVLLGVDQAVQQHEEEAADRVRRAYVLLGTGCCFAEALAQLEEANRLRPSCVQTLYSLTCLSAIMGRAAECSEYVIEAVEATTASRPKPDTQAPQPSGAAAVASLPTRAGAGGTAAAEQWSRAETPPSPATLSPQKRFRLLTRQHKASKAVRDRITSGAWTADDVTAVIKGVRWIVDNTTFPEDPGRVEARFRCPWLHQRPSLLGRNTLASCPAVPSAKNRTVGPKEPPDGDGDGDDAAARPPPPSLSPPQQPRFDNAYGGTAAAAAAAPLSGPAASVTLPALRGVPRRGSVAAVVCGSAAAARCGARRGGRKTGRRALLDDAGPSRLGAGGGKGGGGGGGGDDDVSPPRRKPKSMARTRELRPEDDVWRGCHPVLRGEHRMRSLSDKLRGPGRGCGRQALQSLTLASASACARPRAGNWSYVQSGKAVPLLSCRAQPVEAA